VSQFAEPGFMTLFKVQAGCGPILAFRARGKQGGAAAFIGRAFVSGDWHPAGAASREKAPGGGVLGVGAHRS